MFTSGLRDKNLILFRFKNAWGDAIMLQLIIWLAVLIVLLLFCYYISDRRIITPEILFIAGFVPQVLQAFFYIKKWEIELSDDTLAVLIFGGVLFVAASWMAAQFFKRIKRKSHVHKNRQGTLKIDKKILLAFTAFEVFTILLTIYFLISAYGTSLQRAIYLFRAQSMVGYHGNDIEVHMPGFLRICKRVTTGSGFFWAYLLMQRIVLKSKDDRGILIANLLMSAINGFISTGGRKGVFQLIIAALMDLYLLYGANTGWNKKIRFKTILKLITLGFAFVGGFKIAGEAAGRTINFDFGDYLAVYLTAPLKNLDIFIRRGDFGITNISQSVSFAHLVQYLNARGFLQPYQDSFTYNRVNGFNIGNAYTMYFSYIHDFGYSGMVIFIIFSAGLCQYLFQRIKKNSAYDIPVATILYSYLASNLAFSFFGNFFITSIFDTTLIWNVLVWLGLGFIMKKRFVLKTRVRISPLKMGK